MANKKEVKFVLRMPASMHKKLKRRAVKRFTSMNTQVLVMIDRALEDK